MPRRAFTTGVAMLISGLVVLPLLRTYVWSSGSDGSTGQSSSEPGPGGAPAPRFPGGGRYATWTNHVDGTGTRQFRLETPAGELRAPGWDADGGDLTTMVLEVSPDAVGVIPLPAWVDATNQGQRHQGGPAGSLDVNGMAAATRSFTSPEHPQGDFGFELVAAIGVPSPGGQAVVIAQVAGAQDDEAVIRAEFDALVRSVVPVP